MNAPMTVSVPLALSQEAMSFLMPMHIVVGNTGHIKSVGSTIAKLCPNKVKGQRLLEVFEIRRPSSPADFQEFLALAGQRMTLQFRFGTRTAFKGIAVPLTNGEGAVLNLSFGIGVVEAIAKHELTAKDFAPTDLTVEMLYLVEAKSAAMEESRRLNSRLEGARSAAEKQALTDALTGLHNRRAMEEALTRLTASKAHFGLLHMDLDKFKAVNDTQGHAAGDAVLEAVAKILHEEVREKDIVTRVGGDEFVLLFPDIVNTKRLVSIAKRIITRIEEPVPFGDGTCDISASVGITVSTFYATPDAERMLHDADTALYSSKHAGRACASVHKPVQ